MSKRRQRQSRGWVVNSIVEKHTKTAVTFSSVTDDAIVLYFGYYICYVKSNLNILLTLICGWL